MTWQPIKTAKQGAAVVYDKAKGVITNAFLHDAFLQDNEVRATYGYYNNTAYHVTHWWDFGDGKSMPEPPEEAEGRNERTSPMIGHRQGARE
jgi:hypothetical protein